jgi:nitrogenase-associated protein
MVKVIFYEKPGCINNIRQKKWLTEAGHQVEARNLLTEPWTAARLLAFFNNLPVNAWFNQGAPAVKNGEVNPDILTAEQAVHCMLADPLLIRRPLMEVGATRMVGFEMDQVTKLFGPGLHSNSGQKTKNGITTDLELCPKSHAR